MSQFSQIISFLLSYAPYFALLATILTIYFNYKKLGHKIACDCAPTMAHGKTAEIYHVLLSNYKDKPETIFGIYYLTNNQLFPLWECDYVNTHVTPIILKPYESIVVNSHRVTQYYNDNYDFVDINEENLKSYDRGVMYQAIYVATPGKMIRCRWLKKENPSLFCKKNGYVSVYPWAISTAHPLSPEKQYITPKEAKYVINYDFNGSHEIGWIYESGWMEWKGNFNLFSDIMHQSAVTITKFLQEHSPSFITNISVTLIKKKGR